MADIYAEVTAVGIQGLSGTGGATGVVDGATGPAGATGPQGASGISGASGYVGSDGATGPQGIQGASGTQGIDGASGYVGSDGATGAQGASGAPGDRYHTTSNSTFTIGGSGTVTVVTNDLDLDYSTAQTIILADGGNNHQHGRVVSYNPSTGELVFTKTDASGSGTYSSWEINLDGAVGVQGASGVTGSTGVTGASGVQGASGISGASGYVGSDGATGPQGATGFGLVETVFTTSTTDKVVIEVVDPALYRSAKYEMQLSTSSQYQATELRLLIDLPNVYLTQYGTIGDVLGSFESYYSPLSNDYASPDINTGGVSYWNGTAVRVYTTDTDVILGLLSAPAGTVFTLNSGATTFTLEEVFTEVSTGVYGAVASTTRTPTLLINRIEWAGSGDIELRFTPIYAATTLKYLRTTIAI